MSSSEHEAERPLRPPPPRKAFSSLSPLGQWLARTALWLLGLAVAATLAVLMVLAIALSVAYPNLPEIASLTDYRPKLPMRIFSSDGVLIGEFGEERRNFVPIAEIPKVMQHAVLAIEDSRFYEHSGVDYKGVVRAAFAPATTPQPSRVSRDR